MNGRLLLGAAGVALFAATGTAQAADVPMMPTTIAAVAPATAAGPVIEFTARLNNWFEFVPCCDWDIEFEFEGVVDFQNPAGWGFQLLGYHGYEPGDYYYDLGLRAYRGIGGGTLGVYVLTDDLFDWTDLTPGVDIEYSVGNLTIYNDTYAHFDSFHMHSDTVVEFALNDRLTVYGEIDVTLFDGPIYIDHVEVGVEFGLGAITPYAYFHTDLGGFWGVDIGAEFERQLGTGPFSLVGHADIGIHPGDYTDIEASIGIRYAPGEANKPWWW